MKCYPEENLLVGIPPKEVLIHGPSKLFVDDYLWFDPQLGVVSAYTVKPRDVHDHFGVFRGVDMIEFFGQTCISAGTVMECWKEQCSLAEMMVRFRFAFLGLGQVQLHNLVVEGDTLVSICHINHYRFRQMTMSGSVYRAGDPGLLQEFYRTYNSTDFKQEKLPPSMQKIADIERIVGRAIKLEKFNNNTYGKRRSA